MHSGVIDINNLSDIVLIFKRIKKINIKIIPMFFTHWVIILNILLYLGFIQDFQFSIFIITCLISIFGLIITYITPKLIYIPYLKLKIKHTFLRVIDLVIHHLPLVILIYNYDHTIPKDKGIFALIVLCMYLVIYNPFKIYKFLEKK